MSISEELSDGELVYIDERPSWSSLLPLMLIAAVSGFLLFVGLVSQDLLVIGLFGIIHVASVGWMLLQRFLFRYVVTNRRVIAKEGFLDLTIDSAPLEKVVDVEVHQGLFGRIFDFGNIKFDTAGHSDFEVEFMAIDDPDEHHSETINIQEDYQERESFQERKEQRIEQMRDRYYAGDITKEEFEEAVQNIQDETVDDPHLSDSKGQRL